MHCGIRPRLNRKEERQRQIVDGDPARLHRLRPKAGGVGAATTKREICVTPQAETNFADDQLMAQAAALCG